MKIGPIPIKKAMVNLNSSSIAPAAIGGLAVPKLAMKMARLFFSSTSVSLGSIRTASSAVSANCV